MEWVYILICAHQNVGLFRGDQFMNQGSLHLDEWGELHFELEKLWGEYRICWHKVVSDKASYTWPEHSETNLYYTVSTYT